MLKPGRVLLALVLIFLWALPWSATAQSAGQVSLAVPDTSQFPNITTYLRAYDGQGDFVEGLRPGDVRVLENGMLAREVALEQLRPGAQIVAAINAGSALGRRNSQGLSRYDQITEALTGWINRLVEIELDDFSLLSNTGLNLSHTRSASTWLAALRDHEPDARRAVPDFDLLSRAISLAADTPDQPGMGRAVLFITPLPEGQVSSALQGLAALANQQNIRIFIWLVASEDQFELPAAVQMQTLANLTGGRLFPFSGTESFPDLETWFEPLRSVYKLSYTSQAAKSGVQQLTVETNLEGTTVASPPVSYLLTIAPPNPVFISPPLEIIRRPAEGDKSEQPALFPVQTPLEILIEFPDGYIRDLQLARLFVDGEMVSQNLAPPFEQFTWSLERYQESAGHLLRIEVVDILGLAGTTIELPVTVTVSLPPPTVLETLEDRSTEIIIFSVLLLATGVLAYLLLSGRLKPRLPAVLLAMRRASRERPGARTNEENLVSSTRFSEMIQRFPWLQRRPAAQPIAYLESIAGGSSPARPLAILHDTTAIGRESKSCTLLLEHPSLERLHTILEQRSPDEFWVSDMNTLAGTWVNYRRVPPEGMKLEHGDHLHIGQLGYRFVLANPRRTRKLSVLPAKIGQFNSKSQ